MHGKCERVGVHFILGEERGQAASLLFRGKRCVAVRTASSEEHRASHTILCLGAHIARLLPLIAPQIFAKAWSVAHLQLSPEQAKSIAGIPVVDYVPNTDSRSLLVVSGDSGHAFKMLPVIGNWVRQVLEKGTQELDRWKWKVTPDGDTNDIHWIVGSVRDVKDVADWVPEYDTAQKTVGSRR
ncbi:hypothetical protein PC129_g24932 [Phytophthora cactorum]|uniref:FAD dependent oxidoreductase domain-containing protein n=1 Tax=Phytophthora cactorum TaxID=29920 RepID=A0A8T1GZ91_9STRA|nr:hypothetical protein PC129_g24932 [Phytophthora cactorum]